MIRLTWIDYGLHLPRLLLRILVFSLCRDVRRLLRLFVRLVYVFLVLWCATAIAAGSVPCMTNNGEYCEEAVRSKADESIDPDTTRSLGWMGDDGEMLMEITSDGRFKFYGEPTEAAKAFVAGVRDELASMGQDTEGPTIGTPRIDVLPPSMATFTFSDDMPSCDRAEAGRVHIDRHQQVFRCEHAIGYGAGSLVYDWVGLSGPGTYSWFEHQEASQGTMVPLWAVVVMWACGAWLTGLLFLKQRNNTRLLRALAQEPTQKLLPSSQEQAMLVASLAVCTNTLDRLAVLSTDPVYQVEATQTAQVARETLERWQHRR